MFGIQTLVGQREMRRPQVNFHYRIYTRVSCRSSHIRHGQRIYERNHTKIVTFREFTSSEFSKGSSTISMPPSVSGRK